MKEQRSQNLHFVGESSRKVIQSETLFWLRKIFVCDCMYICAYVYVCICVHVYDESLRFWRGIKFGEKHSVTLNQYVPTTARTLLSDYGKVAIQQK